MGIYIKRKNRLNVGESVKNVARGWQARTVNKIQWERYLGKAIKIENATRKHVV